MKKNYESIINSLTEEQISELVSQADINNIINDHVAAFDIAGTCCGLVEKISKIPVLGKFAVNVNVLCNLFVACCKKEYCIPAGDMAVLAGALAYIALPVDLIPDAVPLVGLLDDQAVVLLAYQKLSDVIAEYKAYVTAVNMADFMQEIKDEYDKRKNGKESAEESQEV